MCSSQATCNFKNWNLRLRVAELEIDGYIVLYVNKRCYLNQENESNSTSLFL